MVWNAKGNINFGGKTTVTMTKVNDSWYTYTIDGATSPIANPDIITNPKTNKYTDTNKRPKCNTNPNNCGNRKNGL